ncbi:REJ domain-containing protein, partial [Ochromonadaceae sp. CCMP2298]
PSSLPTGQPSLQPTSQPTTQPTSQPTTQPTGQPTSLPSGQPSGQPTTQPTGQPTSEPTGQPTCEPTGQPTTQPSRHPTAQPSGQPTSGPSGQPSTQPSSQPTSQPSSLPSGQPSAQPSSSPSTSFPSSAPSSEPTRAPQSSAPTLEGQTLNPTSVPTAQPSFDLTDYPTDALYLEYQGLMQGLGQSDALVFSSFNYKGKLLEGQCATWEQYYSAVVRLPFDDVYFSSLTVHSKRFDFASQVQHAETATCSETAVLAELIYSLSYGVSFNKICSGKRFRVEVCPDYGTSFCVGCNQVCKPSRCTDAVTTFTQYVNPCQECDTRRASYDILDLRFKRQILYPQLLQPITITPGRDSLLLALNLTLPGTAYCYALPEGEPAITSEFTVKTRGTEAFSLTGGELQVLITGLDSAAQYAVYCYTEDFRSHTMTLAHVLATKVDAETLCCPQVQFDVFHLYSGGSKSVYQFSLDSASATSRVNITLSVNASACPYAVLGTVSAAVAQPAKFVFSNGTASGSFIVQGTPGCYVLHAWALTSAGQGQFTETSFPLYVLGPRVAALPPKLASAALSNSGLTMTVRFSDASDRGKSVLQNYLTSFGCWRLFTFTGAAAARCQWAADDKVVATFQAGAKAIVGGPVQLQAGVLRSVLCDASTNCLYAQVGVVTIAAPSSPVIPSPSLASSQQIGSCDVVALDPTDSSGNGGRPWLSVQWRARYTVQPSTLPAATYSSLVTSIEVLLNSNYPNTNFQAVVPNNLLAVGTLQISLILTNFLGRTSETAVQVQILPAAIPSVSIAGSRLVLTTHAEAISLSALASMPACAQSAGDLSYKWSLYKDTTLVTNIPSIAKDPRNYKLSPFSLSVPSFYTVQVVVQASGGAQATASVKLQIVSGGVVARLNGGINRRYSSTSMLLLDASVSYDEDDPLNTNALEYAWTCMDTSAAHFGAACLIGILTPTVQNTVSFASYAGSQDRTLLFTLTITNTVGLSSSIAVSVEVFDAVIPIISLSAPLPKYNPGSKIIFTGILVGTSAMQMEWDVPEIANASSVFLTPANGLVSPGLTVFQQALGANTLDAGASYTVRVAVNYVIGGGSAFSEMVLVINAPPQGGELLVTPPYGTELNTSYLLQTFGWADEPEDLPLSYSMAYIVEASRPARLLKGQSPRSFTSVLLGRGMDYNDFNVTCVVTASDKLGAIASAESQAAVMPLRLSSAALESRLASLLDASLSSLQPEQVAQLILGTSDSLNLAECTLAPPSKCAALHRDPCFTTRQTCGPCLEGYVGLAGDQNKLCIATAAASTLAPLGSACNSNDTCLSQLCSAGFCADPPKSCPNDCSGAGQCLFSNFTGGAVDNCSASDAFCTAACSCQASAHGSDCSLGTEQFGTYRRMREKMCASLLAASLLQDLTSDVVVGRAQMISGVLMDPLQVSAAALGDCAAALTATLAQNQAVVGGEAGAYFVETLSDVLGVPGLPADLLESLSAAYEALSAAIQSTLAVGEPMTSYTTKNMRFGSVLLGANATGAQMTLPQSALEKLAGRAQTTLNLEVAGGIVDADGALGLTVFQYNQNLLGGRTNAQGVGLQSSSYGLVNGLSTNGRRNARRLAGDADGERRLTDRRLAVDSGVGVAITLQNIKPVSYFSTVPQEGIIDCLRTGVPHNITLDCSEPIDFLFACPGTYGQRYNYTCPSYELTPFCTSWDGTANVVDPSCEVVAFDATYTTCKCETSGTVRQRRLAGDSDVQQFSSTADFVATPFVQAITLVGPLFVPLIEQDPMVLLVQGCMVGLITLVWLCFSFFDYTHLRRRSKKKRDHHRPASSAVLELNYSYPLYEDGLQAFTEEAKVRVVSIDDFFNALLPKELTGLPWYTRLVDKLSTEYDLYSLFQRQRHVPKRLRAGGVPFLRRDTWAHTEDHHHLKSLRWLLVAARALNFLFFATVFVSAFYFDDGTCENSAVEETCLSYRTLMRLDHLCEWEPTLDSACSFKGASIANPLAVLLLAALVTLAALPFDHLFYFVVVKMQLADSDMAEAFLAASRRSGQVVPVEVEPAEAKEAKDKRFKSQAQHYPYQQQNPTQAGKGKVRPKPGEAPRQKGKGKYASQGVQVQVGLWQGGDKTKASSQGKKGAHMSTIASALSIFSRSSSHTHEKPAALVEREEHGGYVHAGTALYARNHELRGVMTQRALLLRGARLLLLQAKSDRVSSKREVQALLQGILRGEVLLPSQAGPGLLRRFMRLCISRQEREGQEFSKELGEDTVEFVERTVTKSRREAKKLRRTVAALGSDLDKEAFLVQHFLVEQLPPLQRRIASLFLFRKVRLSQIALSKTALQGLFLCLMGYLLFAAVHLFQMGTAIGPKAAKEWVIVVALCVGYDLLVLQPVKIFVRWVGVASLASSDLLRLHGMLRTRCRFILCRRGGVLSNHNDMVQHSSSACRAARAFPELAASRLLMSLNDADLPVHVWTHQPWVVAPSHWAAAVGKRLLWLVLLPLQVCPSVMHEFFLEAAVTGLLNALLVGLAVLALLLGPSIPIGIAALLLLGLLGVLLWVCRLEAKRSRTIVDGGEDPMLQEEDEDGMRMEDIYQDAEEEVVKSKDAKIMKRHAQLESAEFSLPHRGGGSMAEHLRSKEARYSQLIDQAMAKAQKARSQAEKDEQAQASKWEQERLAQVEAEQWEALGVGLGLGMLNSGPLAQGEQMPDFAPDEMASPSVQRLPLLSPRDEGVGYGDGFASPEKLIDHSRHRPSPGPASAKYVPRPERRYVPRHVRRQQEMEAEAQAAVQAQAEAEAGWGAGEDSNQEDSDVDSASRIWRQAKPAYAPAA